MRYSPLTGKSWRIAIPPREPSGRSALCRSSWLTCRGISNAGRRHRARAQLRDNFFQRLRMSHRVRSVQTVELEAGGVEFLVMAGDAVLVEDGPGRGRCRGGTGLRLPGRGLNAR